MNKLYNPWFLHALVDYNHGELSLFRFARDCYNALCSERHGENLSYWDWATTHGLPVYQERTLVFNWNVVYAKYIAPGTFPGYVLPSAQRQDVRKWMAPLQIVGAQPWSQGMYFILVATKERKLWQSIIQMPPAGPVNELVLMHERHALMNSVLGEGKTIFASNQPNVLSATFSHGARTPHGKMNAWVFEVYLQSPTWEDCNE